MLMLHVQPIKKINKGLNFVMDMGGGYIVCAIVEDCSNDTENFGIIAEHAKNAKGVVIDDASILESILCNKEDNDVCTNYLENTRKLLLKLKQHLPYFYYSSIHFTKFRTKRTVTYSASSFLCYSKSPYHLDEYQFRVKNPVVFAQGQAFDEFMKQADLSMVDFSIFVVVLRENGVEQWIGNTRFFASHNLDSPFQKKLRGTAYRRQIAADDLEVFFKEHIELLKANTLLFKEKQYYEQNTDGACFWYDFITGSFKPVVLQFCEALNRLETV